MKQIKFGFKLGVSPGSKSVSSHSDTSDLQSGVSDLQAASDDRGTGGKNGAEMERCAVCGCVTDVERNVPVSLRSNYIYGAGQLCEECIENLEKKEEKKTGR